VVFQSLRHASFHFISMMDLEQILDCLIPFLLFCDYIYIYHIMIPTVRFVEFISGDPTSESVGVQLTFEQQLSSITHSRLLSFPSHTKQAQTKPTRTEGPKNKSVSRPAPSSVLNQSISAPTIFPIPLELVDEQEDYDEKQESVPVDISRVTIVSGTDHKKRILDTYQALHGEGYSESIVVAKKGKLHHNEILSFSSARMRPSNDKSYSVREITLYNVITIVINNSKCLLEDQDIVSIQLVNKDFSTFIPKIIRWMNVDFTSLKQLRIGYESQEVIDPHRVEMANALMVHCGLDPGKAVRYLGSEYTGENRDVHTILSRIRDHVEDEDYKHIRRILLTGAPFEFTYEEPLANKIEMIRRGNSAAFEQNLPLVQKAINKEDKFSHLVPLDMQICTFSPHCRVTSQCLIQKAGKTDRLCWDGSTLTKPTDEVMNQVTPTKNEMPITFGSVKREVLIDLYNLRVSFPSAKILLALADIKACFRFARIHPDLTGAFGFLAGGFYHLATAMVFGSTTSASSWEPFRHAIEAMSVVFANRPDLVTKHRHYLDMIQWAELDPTIIPVRATPCPLNPGIFNSEGQPRSLPARIYVDDALMAALNRIHMEMVLAAIIESIFTVMGEPNTVIRQCPLAMDKWLSLIVNTRQTMLGLILDTNTMTVGIPRSYLSECLDLLNSTWHVNRRQFKLKEAQEMVGKLARLAEGANWVHHLLSHVYTSIAAALAKNVVLLKDSSQEFKDIIHTIRTGAFTAASKDQSKHVSFAIKKAARMAHGAKFTYFINDTMQKEIEFFREQLNPDSNIRWETPIALLIPRTPTATVFGDSSLQGAGGYSVDMGFWWHIAFPNEIVERTLIHRKNNKDGKLISINVLEYFTIIVNYLASLHVIRTTSFTNDPYPVILNMTDNTSALSWTMHTCKRSKIGRRLARFFCSLLVNSPLGINASYINTKENVIADAISRSKKQKSNDNSISHISFDYSLLKQTFPELSHCATFQIEPDIISLLWDILLTERWPNHESIQHLKQRPLGRLIT